MGNWLVSDSDKLYIIAETTILKKRPILSEKAEEFVSAITKSKNDEDLLWLSGRYCTADARNGNGDGFKLEDLEKMYEYAIFKPVNWLHNEDEKIGFIVDSQLKEEGDEVYVEITGVIWCSTAHDIKYANSIIDYFDKGQLGLSMETMGQRVMCSQCEKIFPRQSENAEDPYGHYCEHLKARRMSDVTRWILDPEFCGVGIIPARGRHKPADSEAWVHEIASVNENEDNGKEDTENMGEKNEVTYSKVQLDELVAAKEDSVRKEYTSLESDLETATSEKVDLEKSIEDFKAEIETKDGEISQVNDDIESLKAEKEDLQKKVDLYEQEKAEVETAKFDGRVEELKKLNDSVTAEVAEKLREDILDDEKYAGVKAMFTKKVEKSSHNKLDLETPDDEHGTSKDADLVRNMLQIKDED